MGPPVLFTAGSQHHAAPGEHLGERGVLLTTQHPAAIDRHAAPRYRCDRRFHIIGSCQRVVVDHRYIEPGIASGFYLRCEMLVRAVRPERARGNQQDHAHILPDTTAPPRTFISAAALSAANDY